MTTLTRVRRRRADTAPRAAPTTAQLSLSTTMPLPVPTLPEVMPLVTEFDPCPPGLAVGVAVLQFVEGQVMTGQEVGVVGAEVDRQVTVGQEVGVVGEGVDVDGQVTVGQEVGVDIVGGVGHIGQPVGHAVQLLGQALQFSGHIETSFRSSCSMSPLSAE